MLIKPTAVNHVLVNKPANKRAEQSRRYALIRHEASDKGCALTSFRALPLASLVRLEGWVEDQTKNKMNA